MYVQLAYTGEDCVLISGTSGVVEYIAKALIRAEMLVSGMKRLRYCGFIRSITHKRRDHGTVYAYSLSGPGRIRSRKHHPIKIGHTDQLRGLARGLVLPIGIIAYERGEVSSIKRVMCSTVGDRGEIEFKKVLGKGKSLRGYYSAYGFFGERGDIGA